MSSKIAFPIILRSLVKSSVLAFCHTSMESLSIKKYKKGAIFGCIVPRHCRPSAIPTGLCPLETAILKKITHWLRAHLGGSLAPSWVNDQVLTNVDYCYKSSAFPQTYQEAMDSPESSNWKAAMEEKMNSLTENNTFTLSDLPEGKNCSGGLLGFHCERNFHWC